MSIQQKIAKIKGVADIVFCIDATGSMQPCIDNVKSNIGTFIRSVETSSPNTKVEWRARILAYRDFNADSDFMMNDFPFVTSPSELQNQLDMVTASGGDDEPESTLDAILIAAKTSDWRQNCHKIIVVFTDATPHTNLNSKTTGITGIPDDFELFMQTVFTETRIKLFLYGQKHPIYDELSKQSRTTVIQFTNAVEELKTADFKAILDTIGKTVSQLASGGEVM